MSFQQSSCYCPPGQSPGSPQPNRSARPQGPPNRSANGPGPNRSANGPGPNRSANGPGPSRSPQKSPGPNGSRGGQKSGGDPNASDLQDEIHDLESLGVLRRSQLDISLHSPYGEHAVDDLDLSHSPVLDVYAHEDDSSMGVLDPGKMRNSMLGAGGEYDFSGPDEIGPYPVKTMNEMSSRMNSTQVSQGQSRSQSPQRQTQWSPQMPPQRGSLRPQAASTPQRPDDSCPCPPARPQRGPPPASGRQNGNGSFGLMDRGQMERSMLGAGNIYDFSGPDENGPHPMEVLHQLTNGSMEPSCFCEPVGSPGRGGPNESMGLMDPSQMERSMLGANMSRIPGPSNNGGGIGPDEIARALETESKVTVFDAEDFNTTMAPRTSNIEIRREVLFSSFCREIDETEEEEHEVVEETIEDFQMRRRHEAEKLSED